MKTTLHHPALTALCVYTLILFLPISVSAQPGNNTCASATLITSMPTCINGTSQLTGQTLANATTTGLATSCGTANSQDVWYRFVAKSQQPTITLSALGTSWSGRQCIQLFSCTGPCTGLAEVGCANASTLTPGTNLTVGNTYYIRIHKTNTTAPTGTNWGFTICVTDPPPANNACAGAITLTSGTTCVNTADDVYAATNSAPTIVAPDCAGTVIYDVWYKFVAQTTNPTITLSSIGAGFTNPALQLLSGSSCTSLTPLFCGTTSIAADYLTPGTTYYIRVYSTGGTPPTTPTNSGFNICITDPVATPPYNNTCANAINLPIWNSCNNIGGNVAGATSSGIALGGSCTGPLAYDVWYKFTSINNAATITLSSIGANFLNPRIEILSGACGSLTSIACGVSPLTASSLTAGATYFVRIYSNTGPAPNGNARFNICATTTNAPIRFGNSYVNITRKSTGGVVQTGDTLEIRMTVNHTSGTMNSMRYVDNVPTKTVMATGANDSIRIITNEGLTYKRYTLAAGDDAATYLASPPAGQYNIRLNLGFGTSSPGIPVNNTSTESASATGTMTNSNKPAGGGGLLFAIAYRVKVTGVIGDTIQINPGQFIYKATVGGPDITLTATPFKIIITDPLTLCTNSIGVNSAEEFGGTFGSGTSLNRSTDLANPIVGYSFIPDVNAYNSVGDGRYAIVKNLSPRSSSVREPRKQNNCNVPTAIGVNDPQSCNNRMFGGFWYVDGDHSGTNDATGNIPPGPNTSGGYMLMVNADYVASEVYRQTINNLCPNTYYEFSAWIRNICTNCGLDSSGSQTFKPGVLPNLSFGLNSVDYYNTGEIDTMGWQKKGFVFKTGNTQTSATFIIRNNSQGGGGNDWAMDDITVATCLPTMSYSPTINPSTCQNNPITIADTISSFFKNYTTYKWQRSTNGGANWTDISGVTTIPDTNYYITSYVVPPANTTLANNGDLYRVVVATTAANLSDPNCNISDGVTITLGVIDCGIPLKTDILSFNGKLINEKGNLTWTTSKEDGPLTFTIERSNNGGGFTNIGTVNSYNNYGAETNTYTFIDPVPVIGKVSYRLYLKDPAGSQKYSRIIQLHAQNTEGFALSNIINPFNYSIEFDIVSPSDTRLEAELIDLFGKVVRRATYRLHTGINALSLPNTETLAPGTYIFRIKNDEILINRKVLKNTN